MKKIFILLAVAGSTALFAQKVQISNHQEAFTGVSQVFNKAGDIVFDQEQNGQNGYGVAYLNNFDAGIYAADDFELKEKTTLTKITGYGFQTSAAVLKLENITTHVMAIIYEGNDDSPTQDPYTAFKTIKLPLGANAKLIKSGTSYTIEINLEAEGINLELEGNKRYWISILPATNDTTGNNRWAWFKATTQEELGEASLIDPEDLFDSGYTEWIKFDDFLTSPWGDFGMAFTLEGKKTLGSNEVIYDKSVSVYPNPVSSSFKIELTAGITVKSVNVHDLTGRQVVSTKGNVSEVNVQSLPKGTYVVTLNLSNGKSVTKKIVKK